jgi:hypothetical protein
MQEKMFIAIESQGHILRETMETILTEVGLILNNLRYE